MVVDLKNYQLYMYFKILKARANKASENKAGNTGWLCALTDLPVVRICLKNKPSDR